MKEIKAYTNKLKGIPCSGTGRINNFFLLFYFLGLHSWPREVPRLGVKLELQLLAYLTATAMPDPSCFCDLHHSSWQCRILMPLNKARDRIPNFLVPNQIHLCCVTMGTPIWSIFCCFCLNEIKILIHTLTIKRNNFDSKLSNKD